MLRSHARIERLHNYYYIFSCRRDFPNGKLRFGIAERSFIHRLFFCRRRAQRNARRFRKSWQTLLRAFAHSSFMSFIRIIRCSYFLREEKPTYNAFLTFFRCRLVEQFALTNR